MKTISKLLQYFGAFIDQHLLQYDQLQQGNQADINNKPVREVRKPSVELIDDKYYWVSGQQYIFLLDHDNVLSYKMSEEEVNELTVEIVYVGPESPKSSNEERVFELLVSMILKMNKMQTSQVYSFPLG